MVATKEDVHEDNLQSRTVDRKVVQQNNVHGDGLGWILEAIDQLKPCMSGIAYPLKELSPS